MNKGNTIVLPRSATITIAALILATALGCAGTLLLMAGQPTPLPAGDNAGRPAAA